MKSNSTMVGWREWVALPDLGVPALKVKIDTGARTSALHAVDIKRSSSNGRDMVSFTVQPIQRNNAVTIRAEAPLVDMREVSDSGGHTENRFVISTIIKMGSMEQEIDITLTERKSMMFRMLIGRTALAGNVIVDPAASYLCGRMAPRKIYAHLLEAQS